MKDKHTHQTETEREKKGIAKGFLWTERINDIVTESKLFKKIKHVWNWIRQN